MSGASVANLEGAHVFNLHGKTIAVADVVAEIERVSANTRGSITCADEPLGSLPATPLCEGVRATIERFRELLHEGRLDTSDLD